MCKLKHIILNMQDVLSLKSKFLLKIKHKKTSHDPRSCSENHGKFASAPLSATA